MKRLFIILAAALLMVACNNPAANDPAVSTQINSAADLAKIGTDPAFPLDGAYRLTANLQLDNWTPLGTYTSPFTGTFDGNNQTVTITGEGGLFGFTNNGAIIKRVQVAGTIIKTGDKNRAVYVGGVAGSAENSVIRFCSSSVTITLTANGHNSSAGGIVGYTRNKVRISDCSSTASVTLQAAEPGRGLMFYGGGVAGYLGTGTAGSGSSGCEMIRCVYSGPQVSVSGAYPYAGGLTGYNYTGAKMSESAALAGTITATGENLPYAGGVSGYNSGFVENTEIVSTIENCYSAAEVTVTAVSDSKYALAGGIVGSNAKRALISKCYARAAVLATVTGDSTTGNGGSLGPPVAVCAGGIAGSQYFDIGPKIENCAALNSTVEGIDKGSGTAWNVYRIAGWGDSSGEDDHDTGIWSNNIARSDMVITQGGAHTDDKGPAGKDGADCDAQPVQLVYQTNLGWDFDKVWKMRDGYPVLQFQL